MSQAGQRGSTHATRGPRYLNGQLNTWGHSYNTLGCAPKYLWNSRLSQALGGTPIYQRGVGGSNLVIGEFTAGKITGGWVTMAQNMQKVPTPVLASMSPQAGIHAVMTGLNDLGNIALMTGSPTSGNQQTALNCYGDTVRACIAYLCCTLQLEAETSFSTTAINTTFTSSAGSAGTNGGSWSVVNSTTKNSGSGYRTTAATGDKMIYGPVSIVSTPEFGNFRYIDLFFLCPGNGATVNGSVITFTDENGTQIYPQGYPSGTPFDTSTVRPAYSNVSFSTPYWKVARFKVAAGAGRQIIAQAGVGGMTYDTTGYEGDYPPPIMWFNVGKTPGANAGVLALVDPVNAITKAIVDEFKSPFIKYIDMDAALKYGDPGGSYGMWNTFVDTTHPSEPGHRQMAAIAYEALSHMPLSAQQSVTLGGGQNLSYLEGVDAVATVNLSGSLSGNATIDGIAMQTGQRVLLTAQTNAVNNGIWVVDTGFNWTRPLDFSTGANAQGRMVAMRSSAGATVPAGTIYGVVSTGTVVIDTAAQTWMMVSQPPAHSINAQTGTSYTLTTTDAGKIVTLNNASPVTLNIDTFANQPIPVGSEIPVTGIGAGLVTVTALSGVTINNPTGASLVLAQNQLARLVCIGTNTWEVNKGSRPPDGSTLAVNASGQLSVATSGITSTQILDGTIANSDLSNMATKTYKGRTSAGTGVPEDVTLSQLAADLHGQMFPYTFLQASGNPLATVVNVSTATALYSTSTPSGVLAGDVIEFVMIGDLLNNQSGGATRTFSLNVQIGGQNIFNNLATANQPLGAARGKWNMTVRLHVNATNVLVTGGRLGVVPTNTSTNWGSESAQGGSAVITAADLITASKTFLFNVTPAVADASIDWRLLSIVGTLYRA